uniref:Uncharacterized protein n=2 Tax=Oryza sativa subsp. japonica TaxID=39947 RepID=Q10HJ8_ORYSJ|nr:hypothetical protein [Oryza sativa Japonica Group]ABF97345.1 retrotransposon, putative, centromere-specific [Oryza sativa Japonica Group]
MEMVGGKERLERAPQREARRDVGGERGDVAVGHAGEGGGEEEGERRGADGHVAAQVPPPGGERGDEERGDSEPPVALESFLLKKSEKRQKGIHKIVGYDLARHQHFHRDMRNDQHDHYEEVDNHEKEERDMKKPPVLLFTLKVEAPPSSEEGIKEELCDNASLISMPQLVNEHAIPNVNSADFKNMVDLHRQDQQPTERCIDH